ncbi:hypothetical protein VULLAG_LOCUS4888 [Vulpes lagopus]
MEAAAFSCRACGRRLRTPWTRRAERGAQHPDRGGPAPRAARRPRGAGRSLGNPGRRARRSRACAPTAHARRRPDSAPPSRDLQRARRRRRRRRRLRPAAGGVDAPTLGAGPRRPVLPGISENWEQLYFGIIHLLWWFISKDN